MRFHPTTTLSYLRRHYFDDEKLKDHAISGFVRAIRAGRLVAFTGSFTTKIFGYPDWETLLQLALATAADKLDSYELEASIKKKYSKLIDTLKEVAKRDRTFDGRVAFSAVAQMLDHISPTQELTDQTTKIIADLYKTAKPLGNFVERHTGIDALFEDLRIKRVVTTNYDLELEVHAMGDDTRKNAKGRQLGDRLRKLIAERDSGGNDTGDYSLDFQLANAERVVSDIMQRDRPEALIEFAVGCPEIDKHLFHLHGRADVPKQMILSYRDYDRLYRRTGLGKAPFEHALRILFAGNPVLFVGLGMTEPEVNATLAEFVGNNPYTRKAPAFLIWNTPSDWKALGPQKHDGSFYSQDTYYPKISADERKAAFRLDKLHRLGILTIFANDLPRDPQWSDTSEEDELLRRSLVSLSLRAVVEHDRRLDVIPTLRWRNALPRIEKERKCPDRIMNTWTVNWSSAERASPVPNYSGEPRLKDEHFITVFIRQPGAGKTSLARDIAESWTNTHKEGWALIINFNMRLDTDSILALIATLLRYETGRSVDDNLLQTSSRECQFRSDMCLGLATGEPLLLILKGLERTFDVNGHPLSAEFDRFLRIMIERKPDLERIRFAVLGTERIRRYFEGWNSNKIRIDVLSPQEAAQPKSPYLDALKKRFDTKPLDKARRDNKALVDYATQRRHIFEAILTADALRNSGVTEPELALDIIVIMSLIGQPIERAVLFHAPRIRDRLGLDKPGKEIRARRRIDRAFDNLLKVGLVGEVNARPGKCSHEQRYAVHISLQSEIRDRNAIPLSESILSTAYNMSLFSAQPADGALPEAELHDELGQLVDWFIGAYKDQPYEASAPRDDRGAPHVVAAFRAGLALVRGLYSTSALLSVDRGDRLVSEERDGLLTEHALRLERMLDAFDSIWRRRNVAGVAVGPEPLYPDELVWLHNERGVVKLAQGDLYEARFSLDEADRINRIHVEFHDESHNWRRITLNQIVIDIERGRLQSADDRMNAIERRLGSTKAEYVRKAYLESDSPRRIRFDDRVSHEDILAMALITGYRGLVGHLRGELDAARSYFDRAISALQRMDEQRALALFRRHKASLLADLKETKALQRECRLSIAGAESVRQLDIVYAGRLVEAIIPDASTDGLTKTRALRTALEALEYATLADMHRLSVEAQARLARIKLESGDYDAALEHVSEAMAVATRYGMTLYKISLRTLMGELLVRRGNTESGKTLIRNAINGAVRVGYQRAIEAARRTLAEAV